MQISGSTASYIRDSNFGILIEVLFWEHYLINKIKQIRPNKFQNEKGITFWDLNWYNMLLI